jgi:hypothetical protein
MEFKLRCKVCGELVDEKNLAVHIMNHDPMNYFVAEPSLKWKYQ